MTDDAGSDERLRSGSRIGVGAGTLLGLCLFLPAYRACGDTIYPAHGFIELDVAWIVVPHLFGLTVAAYALSRLLGSERAAVWTRRTLYGVTAVAALMLGTFFALLVDEQSLVMLPWQLAWLVLASSGVVAFVRRRPPTPDWRGARVIWVGGGMALLWYSMWIAFDVMARQDGNPDDHTLWGTWVATAASVGVIAAGAILERCEQRRKRGPPEALLVSR